MISRSKRYSIIAIILLIAAASTYIYAQMPALAQNITSTVNTARFILFGGSFDVANGKDSKSGVFKLDTYTGDTWILISKKTPDGKEVSTWVPIKNPPQPQQAIPAQAPEIDELNDMR